MSPSGFYHAPVSKGLMAVAAAGTLLTQTMKWSSLGLSHAALFEKLQLWRVGTCHVAFGTAGEAVFGLFLLYHFRMFERQRGTHKYAALAFTCTCAATSMQLAWLLLSPSKGQTLASGPYGLLFALLVQYAYDVPAGSFFSVLGCRFSDKTFMYLLALQLVFSSSTAAAVPSLSGAVAGLLYRADFMRMRRFQFPKSVCRFLGTALGTLLASPKPVHSERCWPHPSLVIPAKVHRPIEEDPVHMQLFVRKGERKPKDIKIRWCLHCTLVTTWMRWMRWMAWLEWGQWVAWELVRWVRCLLTLNLRRRQWRRLCLWVLTVMQRELR